MTENEAIDELNTSIDLAKMCTENLERKREVQGYETAIKALKEIQQYRELEKRLTGMFSGELSLETVVDELERQLKEPDNPHPINAKILTYEDAADWDAYRAIGTPEDFLKMMTNRGFSKENLAQINCNLMLLKEYTAIGSLEECRAAVEKQTAISREVIEGKNFCPKCHNLMPYPGYCGCGQKVY